MKLATKQIKNLGEPRCNMAGSVESTVQGQEKRESSNQKKKQKNKKQPQNRTRKSRGKSGEKESREVFEEMGAGTTLGTL